MKRPTSSEDNLKRTTSIPASMMAPCGMDCGICLARLRDRNRCTGCLSQEGPQQKHCTVCGIKLCAERTEGATFCFDCTKYPCRRLRQLDLRYRTKYGMSMIENLDHMCELGLDRFMAIENTRWVCPSCGSPICVHDRRCYTCGAQYERARSGAGQ
ncbi:MAG: DUF3795 domain-containing protein [Caldiserica bacterium]|nr:DUF3795 domain-containing protein [Caldisericota bacterium]